LAAHGVAVGYPGSPVALFIGHVPTLLEVLVVNILGLFLLAAMGPLAYRLHTFEHLGARSRSALLIIIWCGFVLMPFAVLKAHGPMRSGVTNFSLAYLGVLSSFRLLELLWGTGPKGFDTTMRNFTLYLASPAEVSFDEDGRPRIALPGTRLRLFRRLICDYLLMTLVLSLGRATAFTPFLEGSGVVDIAALPLLGFPGALPAVYLQAAHLYTVLATMLLFYQFLMALLGFDTRDAMRRPLLASTSVRDFWGQRWNLLIHRMMKRSFFEPFKGASVASRRIGGLLAFGVSGLFHEYMWLVLNWTKLESYTPGGPLLFFGAQFAICASEARLRKTMLGRAFEALPMPLQTAITTLVILPFGPLFLRGLHMGGLMTDCAVAFPTVALAEDAERLLLIPGSSRVVLLLRCIVMAIPVGLGLALLHRRRRRLSRVRYLNACIGGVEGGHACVVPVTTSYDSSDLEHRVVGA